MYNEPQLWETHSYGTIAFVRLIENHFPNFSMFFNKLTNFSSIFNSLIHIEIINPLSKVLQICTFLWPKNGCIWTFTLLLQDHLLPFFGHIFYVGNNWDI